jgi:hypothetical protein
VEEVPLCKIGSSGQKMSFCTCTFGIQLDVVELKFRSAQNCFFGFCNVINQMDDDGRWTMAAHQNCKVQVVQ